MKCSKPGWIAFSVAVLLIADGFVNASAEDAVDERVVSSQALHLEGEQPGGVATASYVGDLPCDGCDGGACSSCGGDCSSCGGGCSKRGGGCSKCGHCSSGGCGFERSYGRPDLFFNYYTQGNANRTNAQMYLSPLPVPPNVGHTYFTYQPFYPHEMLYAHKDKFHNYYDNGRGMNRTRAVYSYPHVCQAVSNVYWNYLRLPR